MADEISFTSLLSAASGGRRDAISDLWRAHQPGLLRWLQSMDRFAAEDLASETWVDALRSSGSFEGDESGFRAFLFTIARRRLIDYRRRMGKRPDFSSSAVPEATDQVDTSNDAVTAITTAHAVALIKSTLPANQAEVVLMRVLGGLSVAQVAEVTEKSPEAVRVLQHRGLRKLAAATSPSISERFNKEEV